VKAVQVSLWPWCLTGRLGSRYIAGNSLGRIAEPKDWTRRSYINKHNEQALNIRQ